MMLRNEHLLAGGGRESASANDDVRGPLYKQTPTLQDFSTTLEHLFLRDGNVDPTILPTDVESVTYRAGYQTSIHAAF